MHLGSAIVQEVSTCIVTVAEEVTRKLNPDWAHQSPPDETAETDLARLPTQAENKAQQDQIAAVIGDGTEKCDSMDDVFDPEAKTKIPVYDAAGYFKAHMWATNECKARNIPGMWCEPRNFDFRLNQGMVVCHDISCSHGCHAGCDIERSAGCAMLRTCMQTHWENAAGKSEHMVFNKDKPWNLLAEYQTFEENRKKNAKATCQSQEVLRQSIAETMNGEKGTCEEHCGDACNKDQDQGGFFSCFSICSTL